MGRRRMITAIPRWIFMARSARIGGHLLTHSSGVNRDWLYAYKRLGSLHAIHPLEEPYA
jgi:hypothetical protein